MQKCYQTLTLKKGFLAVERWANGGAVLSWFFMSSFVKFVSARHTCRKKEKVRSVAGFLKIKKSKGIYIYPRFKKSLRSHFHGLFKAFKSRHQ